MTEAPGPGTYRMHSEFGVYSPGDTQNRMTSEVLSKISSQKSI